MKILFTAFYTLFTLAIIGQSAFIKGKVTDKRTKEDLIGANVILEDGKGAAVDYKGTYSIKASEGEHIVTFKFIGYEEEVRKVTLTEGETVFLNIELSEGNQLNDVVISASKFEQKLGEVAVSMNVIKPELIDNKATVTPEDIIDQCPGVQMNENQVSIRGGSGFSYGSGSRVLLMVDDLPMLTADAGDIKWTSIPLENTEQIEVIKGASSVLYGSSALNGIINIRTAYPRAEPMTKINISNGIYMPSTGTQKGTSVSGGDSIIDRTAKNWNPNTNYYVATNFLHSRRIKENFDLVVGGNYTTDLGYRVGEDEHRGRLNFNTRYRSKKIDGLSFGVNGNHNQAKGALFFLWQNADSVYYPQGLTDTATTTLSEFYTYRTNIDPYITYYDSSGNKHSLRGRWFNTINQNSTNQGSKANLYYVEYQFQKHWKKDLTTTIGVMNNYSTVEAELYGNHFANNTAGFLQADKKLGKFTFSAGMRVEYYKIDSTQTKEYNKLFKDTLNFKPVMRFGTTYELAKFTFLRASYGEGYRFPTIAERYVQTNVGGLNIFPNAYVGAESGWSAELGLKQGVKIGNFRGYLDLAGFVTGYSNMMEFTFGFYETDGTPWDFDNPSGVLTFDNFGAQSKNVENAIIKGGEVSFMGTGEIGPINVTTLIGYTYIDPRSAGEPDSVYLESFSDSSTVLKYRSKHLFKADLQLDYKGFSLGGSTRYNSFQENVDETFVSPFLGNLILPGYNGYREARRTGDIIVDLRMSYKITKTSKVAILMNNALNREYSSRPGNVMPPRTLIFQYSFKF
jgi:iron complex outermembrane receptor protein